MAINPGPLEAPIRGNSVGGVQSLTFPGLEDKILSLLGATVAKFRQWMPDSYTATPLSLVLGLPKLVWKCVGSHS